MLTGTREELMRTLLQHRDRGLTIDELSRELEITRNAVHQHLVGLERDGLVATVEQRSTGGRPSRAYGLTEQGLEVFPRNYALMAQGLLATAADTLGEEAVERLLMEMARRLSDELSPKLDGLEGRERFRAVIVLMNELGYEASELGEERGISAVNCIYHKLARQTRAVCRYDDRLLSLLLGEEVQRTCCMADGDARCEFLVARGAGQSVTGDRDNPARIRQQ